ncbi:hypothetical protein OSB04_031216 [Centaurea solstitialis]|uniref:CCHC-type domain-containing protein n=1 Tax=Centaurea solstitialis TaxID=347529 RepID=A0AA38S9X0_9ASTR|nr:hypothetical protein OSB04_031216 [Centaurea solstitialis]
MANTVTNTNNLSLRSILEKDKLTEANFLDWERNLMIVLRHERKWYVLEEPLGEAPPANATATVRNVYRKHSDDLLDVGCLMLATMSPDLQTGPINTNAYDMIRQLRDMFQMQACTERYDATRALNACKMAKGTSVSDHVMKMKRHIYHLERFGHPVPLQLAPDTILNSLSKDYKQFVINYNMNNMEKTIAELDSMLKTAELSMGTGTKTKDVLMVRDGRVKRKRGHENTSKGKSQPQASQSVTKVENNDKRKGKGKKVKPTKARTENRCFKCHEAGHRRQNCPKCHEAGINTSDMDPRLKDALKKIDEHTGSYDHLPWEENFRRVIKDLEQLVQFSRQLKEAPTDDHVIKFVDEVSPRWSDSDDSDEEFSWQDNTTEEDLDDDCLDEDCLDELRVLLQDDLSEESSPDQSPPQQKDETMGEQSDGKDFEQVGYEEQTQKENLSPIQPKVKSPISECDDTNNEPLFCQPEVVVMVAGGRNRKWWLAVVTEGGGADG